MKSFRATVVVFSAAVALAGCKFPGAGDAKPPTGQVVARVGDHEVTLRDLQAEMGDETISDPKARKSAEQAALGNIVGRTILADAAREQGLDKTPDFAIQKERVYDTLLVQTLQQKVAGQVPQPTKQEGQEFVTGHPDIFSERKVFLVDQIRMSRPTDPAVLKSLEPLKTLDQVETVLKTDSIPYQRAGGSLDAVGADPRLVDQIMKLPPNEVFVIPGGNGLLVNQIRETKVIPFTGDPALDYAMKLIARQRNQETVQRSMRELMSKAAPNVKFNKDYAPPKPATASAGASQPVADAAKKP